MEKVSYKDFTYYVGKTIEYCQTIEQDVKWLYAFLKGGNPLNHMNDIANWTLGNTVFELQTLDAVNQVTMLQKKDYALLKDITQQRNYICHQIYRDFIYEENFIDSDAYLKACKKLLTFYKKIFKLQKEIETFRIMLGSKIKI